MVKKILLGLFVVIVFIAYTIHQRGEDNKSLKTTAQAEPPKSSQSPQYKDGTYKGKSADAFYGYVQVQAVVNGGKLTAVDFLSYPNDRRDSIQINNIAMPKLKSQAIAAQSANIDGVSGATDTSMAFVQSLSDAINQAQQ